MGRERQLEQAMALKKSGIRIITVSVGTSTDVITLRELASYPISQNMYSVRSHRDLNKLVGSVLSTLCDGKYTSWHYHLNINME